MPLYGFIYVVDGETLVNVGENESDNAFYVKSGDLLLLPDAIHQDYRILKKPEGIEQSRLAAEPFTLLHQALLIPSIVASDSLGFAIATALVRLHFDKPLDHHSNGVENKFLPCLSFHMINNLYLVKTTDSLDSSPPLELSVFE